MVILIQKLKPENTYLYSLIYVLYISPGHCTCLELVSRTLCFISMMISGDSWWGSLLSSMEQHWYHSPSLISRVLHHQTPLSSLIEHLHGNPCSPIFGFIICPFHLSLIPTCAVSLVKFVFLSLTTTLFTEIIWIFPSNLCSDFLNDL